MAADYPDGTNTAGPYALKLMDQPTEYQVTRYEYEDGGADVNVQPCGLRSWVLEYDGLTEAEITTLRTHYNDARGMVEEFNFYHRRDATLYPNVKYKEFKIGRHVKAWSNVARVVLVQFA